MNNYDHISEDDLELYALGRNEAAAAIEEHLLVCQACMAELEQVESDIQVIREALRCDDEVLAKTAVA